MLEGRGPFGEAQTSVYNGWDMLTKPCEIERLGGSTTLRVYDGLIRYVTFWSLIDGL